MATPPPSGPPLSFRDHALIADRAFAVTGSTRLLCQSISTLSQQVAPEGALYLPRDNRTPPLLDPIDGAWSDLLASLLKARETLRDLDDKALALSRLCDASPSVLSTSSES